MTSSQRPWLTPTLSATLLAVVCVFAPVMARAQQTADPDSSSAVPSSAVASVATKTAAQDDSARDASSDGVKPDDPAKNVAGPDGVNPADAPQDPTVQTPHPQTPGPNATPTDTSTSPTQTNPQADQEPPGGKRVFGVLPNYRTADASQEGVSISAHQKLVIASKDSFDYPLVILAAALAGVSQLGDQNPSFGQGVKGYAHRLVTGYADQALGNMFTEGLFPMMLHEDPRYFRRGTGSVGSRTGYALTRIFVTKTDAGGSRFNYSEWLGNASAVAISNAYYPDGRNWSQNSTKLLEQCATDAISQVLKEFWPDIKRKWFHKDSH
jgi:hypothetical protein